MEVIKENQYYCGKILSFDPDSSPAAWEYYKEIYPSDGYLKEKYNFDVLVFCKFCKYSRKDDYNYKNEAETSGKVNRMFALSKQTEIKYEGGIQYFKPNYRLGGECDFNFNKKKYELFKNIINNDMTASDRDKENALYQLEKCHKTHHTVLNFSLMQSVGNLQEVKGSDCGVKGSDPFDRFDTFVSNLNEYYLGNSDLVLQSATSSNKSMLKLFLDEFKDIYEYCSIFYQLNNRKFVDRIIKEGSMPICNVSELTRYMTLAEEYWSLKRINILTYVIPHADNLRGRYC